MTESLGITNAKLLVEQHLFPGDPGLEAFLGFLDLLATIEENPTPDLLVARDEIEVALCSSYCSKNERYAQLHSQIIKDFEEKDPNA